jgi:hypothetical protein
MITGIGIPIAHSSTGRIHSSLDARGERWRRNFGADSIRARNI